MTKIIFGRKFKKDKVICDKQDVVADVKKSKKIFLLEDGKMDNGDEFIIVKIIV